ncbi:unnamed protein product, partial [Brenthis ino]
MDNHKKYDTLASKLLICFSLPSFIFYVLSTVLDFATGNLNRLDINIFTYTILNVSLPIIPAILSELVISEVDKIKSHLKKQLLICPSVPLQQSIYDSLYYLELRPFKYSVLRIFHVDISLPLALISFCTTYSIIIVQFTSVLG